MKRPIMDYNLCISSMISMMNSSLVAALNESSEEISYALLEWLKPIHLLLWLFVSDKFIHSNVLGLRPLWRGVQM